LEFVLINASVLVVGAGIAKDYKEETEPNLHVKTFFLETFDEEKGS